MFFIGILVPFFGELEITDSGWQVWKVGIIGFFGCWVFTWFVDIDKIDQAP